MIHSCRRGKPGANQRRQRCQHGIETPPSVVRQRDGNHNPRHHHPDALHKAKGAGNQGKAVLKNQGANEQRRGKQDDTHTTHIGIIETN